MHRRFLIPILVLFFGLLQPISAQEAPKDEEDQKPPPVEYDFGGTINFGRPGFIPYDTPSLLTFYIVQRNGDPGRFTLRVSWRDRNDQSMEEFRSITLTPGVNRVEQFIADTTRDTIRASLVSEGGKTVANTSLNGGQLDPLRKQVLVVGGSGIGLRLGDAEREPVTENARYTDIPDSWVGLAAFDTIIIPDYRPTSFRSIQQIDALRKWTISGGRLVLGVHRNWTEAAPDPAGLVPSEPTALEAIPPSRFKLVTAPGLTPPADVGIARFPATYALQQFSDGTPWLLGQPRGWGFVYVVPFDLTSSWIRTSGRVDEVLSDVFVFPAFDDQDGELEPVYIPETRRLDSFKRTYEISTGLVMLILVLYLAFIGPLDYFVLRKVGKMELTWLTLPVYSLVAILVFYGMSRQQNASLQAIREIVYVDGISGQDEHVVTHLAAIYTPDHMKWTMATPRGDGYIASPPWQQFSGSGGFTDLTEGTVIQGRKDGVHALKDYVFNPNATQRFNARWVEDKSPPPVTIADDGTTIRVTNRRDRKLLGSGLISSHGYFATGTIDANQTIEIRRPIQWVRTQSGFSEYGPDIRIQAQSVYSFGDIEGRATATEPEQFQYAIAAVGLARTEHQLRNSTGRDDKAPALGSPKGSPAMSQAPYSVFVGWYDDAEDEFRVEPAPTTHTSVTFIRMLLHD